MANFTPWSALAGGCLIGLAAALLLVVNGRIAGISGILGGVFAPARGERSWRVFFIAGLLATGVFAALFVPSSIGAPPRSPLLLMAAGLLVGVGTRLANGCTSGHGVCGIGRLSPRSLAATLTFIAAGMLVVHIVGGAS
jgi:uncharacterized membrane protein YedE/YeeE